jgi:hypothetical protein
VTKFVIELLDQHIVTLIIHVLVMGLVGFHLGIMILLVYFDLLLPLLVDGCLMQHEEGCVPVSRAH